MSKSGGGGWNPFVPKTDAQTRGVESNPSTGGWFASTGGNKGSKPGAYRATKPSNDAARTGNKKRNQARDARNEEKRKKNPKSTAEYDRNPQTKAMKTRFRVNITNKKPRALEPGEGTTVGNDLWIRHSASEGGGYTVHHNDGSGRGPEHFHQFPG